MKKVLLFCLSLLIVLAAAACAKNTQESTRATIPSGSSVALGTLSESEIAGSRQSAEAYSAARAAISLYLADHPDGVLARSFAGVITDGDGRLVILLTDPNDKEALKELLHAGIKGDYEVKKGSESFLSLKEAERQMRRALSELEARTGRTEEEEELITKYKPVIKGTDLNGTILVTLTCDSPWSSGISMSEMKKDREHAIALFEKYIGKYDAVEYDFPI